MSSLLPFLPALLPLQPLQDPLKRLLQPLDLALRLLDVVVQREGLGEGGKGGSACEKVKESGGRGMGDGVKDGSRGVQEKKREDVSNAAKGERKKGARRKGKKRCDTRARRKRTVTKVPPRRNPKMFIPLPPLQPLSIPEKPALKLPQPPVHLPQLLH